MRASSGVPLWSDTHRTRSPGFVRRLRSYYGEVRLASVHHRLRLLAFPLAGQMSMGNPAVYAPIFPIAQNEGVVL